MRLPAFAQRLGHHQFSLGSLGLFIAMVLSAAASLRGASRVLELWGTVLDLPEAAPSWYTGRLWLLRVGYYKLTRPKEQATDWVWIIDHTVQMGAEKCLVILGLRLAALPPPGTCLRHEHVEPIALYPVQHSNGAVVYQQLTEAVAQTGVPREILSDGGSDLQAGVAQFRQAHPETCAIYDIKHKTALVLKHELAQDPAWTELTQRAAQTKQRGQQTALAFLVPPTQRRKARYMNVDMLIRWGTNLLGYLAQPAPGRAGRGYSGAARRALRLAHGLPRSAPGVGGATANRRNRRAVRAHPRLVSRLSPDPGANAGTPRPDCARPPGRPAVAGLRAGGIRAGRAPGTLARQQ